MMYLSLTFNIFLLNLSRSRPKFSTKVGFKFSFFVLTLLTVQNTNKKKRKKGKKDAAHLYLK